MKNFLFMVFLIVGLCALPTLPSRGSEKHGEILLVDDPGIGLSAIFEAAQRSEMQDFIIVPEPSDQSFQMSDTGDAPLLLENLAQLAVENPYPDIFPYSPSISDLVADYDFTTSYHYEGIHSRNIKITKGYTGSAYRGERAWLCKV
jgi:hypothetical protein